MQCVATRCCSMRKYITQFSFMCARKTCALPKMVMIMKSSPYLKLHPHSNDFEDHNTLTAYIFIVQETPASRSIENDFIRIMCWLFFISRTYYWNKEYRSYLKHRCSCVLIFRTFWVTCSWTCVRQNNIQHQVKWRNRKNIRWNE